MATPNIDFCAKCGAPLSPGVRFCETCGQPVIAAGAPASQPITQSPKVHKKTGRTILIIFLVLIICAFLGLIAFILLSGNSISLRLPFANA